MRNILSVDVEDWFQVEAQNETIKFSEWHNFKMRVMPNVLRLLGMFDRHGVHATFFILGWVAEKIPDLVDHIVQRGHEVASHGYGHRFAAKQTSEEFRADLEQSLTVLAQSYDGPIHGYRAPSFSLGEQTPWAWDILADLGFAYDSSIFPIHHDTYGSPHLPRHPFRLVLNDGREIDEIPMTTIRLFGHNLPAAGGGYLRLFPHWYTRLAIRRINREGMPAVIYIHPWEIDPGQPRTRLSPIRRFRHYTNLGTTEYKLEQLLSEFNFGTIWDYLQSTDSDRRPRISLTEIRRKPSLPPSKTVKPPPERPTPQAE